MQPPVFPHRGQGLGGVTECCSLHSRASNIKLDQPDILEVRLRSDPLIAHHQGSKGVQLRGGVSGCLLLGLVSIVSILIQEMQSIPWGKPAGRE